MFSNGSVFGDRLPRCSVDDSRIRNRTATFPFENGSTGPEFPLIFISSPLEVSGEEKTPAWLGREFFNTINSDRYIIKMITCAN